MKRVYLVRHAKSSWKDISQIDFGRSLNKRGKRDAPFMGQKLHEQGILPDLLIASPAKRAKNTATIIAAALGYRADRIVFDEAIYRDGLRAIPQIISRVPKSEDSIMLVGHNPDLTLLAEQLSGKVLNNMPTCSIVCLEFDCSNWKETLGQPGKMLFFDYPKKDL